MCAREKLDKRVAGCCGYYRVRSQFHKGEALPAVVQEVAQPMVGVVMEKEGKAVASSAKEAREEAWGATLLGGSAWRWPGARRRVCCRGCVLGGRER